MKRALTSSAAYFDVGISIQSIIICMVICIMSICFCIIAGDGSDLCSALAAIMPCIMAILSFIVFMWSAINWRRSSKEAVLIIF